MEERFYWHYLPARHEISDLRERRLKVCELGHFNDPFEFWPSMRYSDKGIRDKYKAVVRQIEKKWGVLCFSGVWDRQLLWAHYADGHKGVALGFEIPRGPQDPFVTVHYRARQLRPVVELDTGPEAEAKNEERFLALGRVKSVEWHYEDESRLFVPLKPPCQTVDIPLSTPI
jgi:hypothetical protein